MATPVESGTQPAQGLNYFFCAGDDNRVKTEKESASADVSDQTKTRARIGMESIPILNIGVRKRIKLRLTLGRPNQSPCVKHLELADVGFCR